MGAFLLQRPPNPQMRLKYGAFRHLRMAAKGRRPLDSRHLLKKVDENFLIAGGSAATKTSPRGAKWQRGLPRPPFEKGGRKLFDRGRVRRRQGKPLGREVAAGPAPPTF